MWLALQEAEAVHSSQVPAEMQSAPVEDLMDYVVEHTVQWSEQQGWCALCCRAPCRLPLLVFA